jgi:hypothetical protein
MILTPDLEAVRLVDDFRLILIELDSDLSEEILCTILAKELATKCVDEIIQMCDKSDWSFMDRKADYYREVKQEIFKL